MPFTKCPNKRIFLFTRRLSPTSINTILIILSTRPGYGRCRFRHIHLPWWVNLGGARTLELAQRVIPLGVDTSFFHGLLPRPRKVTPYSLIGQLLREGAAGLVQVQLSQPVRGRVGAGTGDYFVGTHVVEQDLFVARAAGLIAEVVAVARTAVHFEPGRDVLLAGVLFGAGLGSLAEVGFHAEADSCGSFSGEEVMGECRMFVCVKFEFCVLRFSWGLKSVKFGCTERITLAC